MEIILFRHGIAEDQGSLESDNLRALTDEGKEKVKAAAAVLERFFGDNKKVVIWSSPMVRALQTSEILQKKLGVKKEISVLEAIGNGDFKAFEESIKAVPDNAKIIVVGHSPYLNEWTEHITGMKFKLSKGGAVGIKILNVSPLSGDILWIVQDKGWNRF